MRAYLRTTALAALMAASAIVATPREAQAQTYAIDCAILLCLSGGWPTSVPCERARAEFIRRITPWPIEPPLQLWRCPMGISFKTDPHSESSARIWDVLLSDSAVPLQSHPISPSDSPEIGKPEFAILHRESGGDAPPLPEGFALQLAQEYADEGGGADIDISGNEFNFVRSIRVFDINWRRWVMGDTDPTCWRLRSQVRIGSYGQQGSFSWRSGDAEDAEAADAAWLGFNTRREGPCSDYENYRAVGVEWRDYDDNRGYEVVRY